MKRLPTAMLAVAAWLGTVHAPGIVNAAEPTPGDWLSRMDSAIREHDYDGIFSYYGGNDVATLRIVHKVVDGIERKRIVHLNGAPREIIGTGREITHIVQPGDNLLALENSMPTGPYTRVFMRRFAALGEHYDMRLKESGRIAGRKARRLDILPRDRHRFGYRLWIDVETGLLLRSELRNERGENLEIFQFATLKVGSEIDDSELVPEAATDAVTKPIASTSQNLEGRDAPLPWRAQWIPPGFRMTSADVRRSPSESKDVHTMMFSDGLAAFSIFIEAMPGNAESADNAGDAIDGTGGADSNGFVEPADIDAPTALDEGTTSDVDEVVSRNGATVALTHPVRGPSGESVVIVVGEVPVATARRIAQGVHHER